MTVDQWLKEVSDELADAMIPSARLDAEIILAHTIGKPRTWLHAHGDEELDPRRKDIADARAELRLERVPVAYIIGHKDFYGRRFYVSPDVLIPRPESETIITILDEWLVDNSATQLVDVGTGSGCLGITAKLEHPELHVTLLDDDKKTLDIAEKNAQLHTASVRMLESNLLDSYPLRADIIIANLPYVGCDWSTSEDTRYEPSHALYAENDGLELIYQLIDQATTSLSASGIMLLEADPRQHQRITDYGAQHGFSQVSTHDFIVMLQR